MLNHVIRYKFPRIFLRTSFGDDDEKSPPDTFQSRHIYSGPD